MNQREVLYICLSDDKKDLYLLPKQEVEKSIKSMEEDPDNDLLYSVVGSINQTKTGIPFLITYKMTTPGLKQGWSAPFYDVVYAPDGIQAHNALLGKKRLADKAINITNTLDLRKLITEYYE